MGSHAGVREREVQVVSQNVSDGVTNPVAPISIPRHASVSLCVPTPERGNDQKISHRIFRNPFQSSLRDESIDALIPGDESPG